MKTDIKIGDYVTVVNEERIYLTYEDWARSNNLKNWKRGNSCSNGFSGVVTEIAYHGIYPSQTLIAVCGDGHEIIINIEGVKKVENTSCGMKPIKRGMTEAVTRDGRKVTQLTWFDGVEDGMDSVCGVLDGSLCLWPKSGMWIRYNEAHENDIFAPVEYEWQWLIKNNDGTFTVSSFREFDLSMAGEPFNKGESIWHSRIEESKREVK